MRLACRNSRRLPIQPVESRTKSRQPCCGLRYLIANPSKLADFIQSEFVLTNGTRISAKSLAVDVCALLRTCAVA